MEGEDSPVPTEELGTDDGFWGMESQLSLRV